MKGMMRSIPHVVDTSSSSSSSSSHHTVRLAENPAVMSIRDVMFSILQSLLQYRFCNTIHPSELSKMKGNNNNNHHHNKDDSLSSSSSTFYAKAGDACHAITIVSTLGFALLAGKYMRDPSSTVFDAQWTQEGFCITNRDVAYWNSHDLCLYVDTAMTIVSALLFFAWRKDPGMERANGIFQANIPGVLLHGLGHGALGKAIRDGTANLEDSHKLPIEVAMEQHETTLEIIQSILPLAAFWFFLSKASMPQVSNVYIVLAASLATVRHIYTPNDFGFTYVQTILMLQFAINQLSRPASEKDLSYFLYPAMVGLPLTLVGWMESTMCTTMVKDWLYGHLAYDAYIPLAMMAWYAVVHRTATTTATATTTSNVDDPTKMKKTL